MNLQRGYNTACTYRQIFKLPIRVKHPVCWPQTSKPAEIPIILFLNGCQNVNEAEGQWVNVCPLSLHPFISLKRISMLHPDQDVSFKQPLSCGELLVKAGVSFCHRRVRPRAAAAQLVLLCLIWSSLCHSWIWLWMFVVMSPKRYMGQRADNAAGPVVLWGLIELRSTSAGWRGGGVAEPHDYMTYCQLGRKMVRWRKELCWSFCLLSLYRRLIKVLRVMLCS